MPCIPYSPRSDALSGSLRLPSNLGASALTAPRTSLLMPRTDVFPLPERSARSFALPGRSGASAQNAASRHRCSCPAYRAYCCPPPGFGGSRGSDDLGHDQRWTLRTSLMPCVPYSIFPTSWTFRRLAHLCNQERFSTDAPPDIAAHALHTVRHVARLRRSAIARLDNPGNMFSADAPQDIAACPAYRLCHCPHSDDFSDACGMPMIWEYIQR
jgi:hypothetical protein